MHRMIARHVVALGVQVERGLRAGQLSERLEDRTHGFRKIGGLVFMVASVVRGWP